ncbi:MAG: DNA polymerase III subunit delta [Planctomycetota bacterium]
MAARRAKAREADPPTQLRTLLEALKRDGLAPGYVLRGEERYFRDRALDAVRERATEAGVEVRLHDAQDPDFSLARLLDDLGGGGLFAAAQLVIARNVEKELKKSGKDQSPLTRAVSAFAAAAEGSSVMLSAGNLRADHAAVKAITAAGGAVLTSRRLWDSPPPWGNPDPRRAELVVWLTDRAREMGVRLTPENAVYVAAATGNDLFALEDQLEKLRDAPTGSDLRSVVGWDASASPWAVTDALLGGDLARALGGIESLFRGGFEERDGRRMVDPVGLAMILVGALQAGVRKGLAISTAMADGRSGDDAARAAGVSGAPSTVQAQIARAQVHDPETWRERLSDLAAIERQAKSGGVEADDFVLLAVRWRKKRARARA